MFLFRYLPSKAGKLSNTRASTCKSLPYERLAKIVRRAHNRASNYQQTCTKYGDVSLPEQILQIPNERAHGGNSQSIGDR